MAGGGSPGEEISAWRPRVEGVAEVFHAHFTRHAYPMHVHDTWTLLIVDEGAVRYDLERHPHGTPLGTVSLLPPQVPHNGSAATPHGFRKRVLYLDAAEGGLLDTSFIGPAVDNPDLTDPLLRRRIGQLHAALAHPGDELEAAARLTFVAERLRERLRPGLAGQPRPGPDRRLAVALRELLDERIVAGVGLAEAAGVLHAHPAHLVRSFGAAYGIAPHQYLTARRIDRARGLLLDGVPAGEVAVSTGFHDQPHLTRHFKRIVGMPPTRYARSGPGPGPGPA
ncbi:helix-turn-helix domain-containing protein [Streptomyces sp. SID5785]|uniref:helix-turn-helix transcriptional regulator n=1 Tax=Streptomyces sp. SID5785 TaxID=2690309 RepID=UPI00136105C2|nr:AraC family transcriptional regulator [Streptomyces sp. SID5785]MZD09810.1 helix-turn-helix domain-containing protein [Streptomyces sp. SID5785]